jgi:hypothetical protein
MKNVQMVLKALLLGYRFSSQQEPHVVQRECPEKRRVCNESQKFRQQWNCLEKLGWMGVQERQVTNFWQVAASGWQTALSNATS